MAEVSFKTKLLRREVRAGDYGIYLAAQEWDLADPILIEKREDMKSERRWGERLTPYHHQVNNLITFCRRLPVTLLADDVGLGKTISAGLIVSELIARGRLSRILVVCPKLLGPQWKEELASKFDIPSEVATGRELLEAEPEGNGAVITTYNSARLYLDQLPQDRFQMLILDEAHKLRNLHGVDQPPQVALRFREALQQRRFRFVLMLTATPIQNRLWDLYSLVDLLTVARGHQNPFGSPGMFARKFIADSKTDARKLEPKTKEEFRSIVYGYMSRVRRGDANLYFPDRTVQMHKVNPTREELELIKTIAKPIKSLNRLAQISILQALTSSPHALQAQLKNMARRGSVPQSLSDAVERIVSRMPLSAKLRGLSALIDRLKREDPNRWRLVVFTGRRETQTTIETFLEAQGLKVGIINGDSGGRNQETLAAFRKNPPSIRVIVSTEAGSEGINLQVANVLVNYDLPWNPMIVEQRIGRVQRLASEHASVGIFNIMLRGTFEEYIVGRLMEKLQMASHAIGDIEALLDASGMGADDDSGRSFDERIRELVIAALTGMDTEAATRQAEQSIENAKRVLETEAATINDTLGQMDGAEYVGPRAPSLPAVVRSMEPQTFVVGALRSLGTNVTEREGQFFAEENGRWRRFVFDDSDAERGVTVYAPGAPAFERLVDRVVATGVHRVDDADNDLRANSEKIAEAWLKRFESTSRGISSIGARRRFLGQVTIRVRATVAHDSYERLVMIPCGSGEQLAGPISEPLRPLTPVIEEIRNLGADPGRIQDHAQLDPAIQEFCRFYLERRELEMRAAGNDARRRKRLEDEFTPRLEMTVVAAEGAVSREVDLAVRYSVGGDQTYESRLSAVPSEGRVVREPDMALCAVSARLVPTVCLGQCAISGSTVLHHLLVRSEASKRCAKPEYMVRCEATGKIVIQDEVTRSDVSGRVVLSSLLQTSTVSGKRAESEQFGSCEFTKSTALLRELATSEISGKSFRSDQSGESVVSGKTGHISEFVPCRITRKLLAPDEGAKCEVSGSVVLPGLLEQCAISGKQVLPAKLDVCCISGRRALKELMVRSSLSGARMLQTEAIRSARGKFCMPAEAKSCSWSRENCHPDDLRTCQLTGLPIKFPYAGSGAASDLQPLLNLLSGVQRGTDAQAAWDLIATAAVSVLGRGRCGVQSATLSPDQRTLAVCFERWTFLGLRAQLGGLVFDLEGKQTLGRMVLGKRGSAGWVTTESR